MRSAGFYQSSVGSASTGGTGIGAQGATGVPGPRGFTGLPGVTGLQGTTGLSGSDGVTGLRGVDGQTGAQGVDGQDGATGAQGLTGIQGRDGVTGSPGATGLRGLDGFTGIGFTGPQGPQGVTGPAGTGTGDGATGPQGVTGTQGIQGVTGPAGGGGSGDGATGLQGETGLPGLSGDGIVWIHAAMLGSATNTVGLFSVQPGNANPFGVPINTPYDQYNNGGVNAIKIPFDYELKEIYLSLGHAAVSAASADATVYANIDFHKFDGTLATSLGSVRVPFNGALCGVYNNLGGNNFQKASLASISGIQGDVGDLVGFRFRNVAGSGDLNAVSRCTILAKLQRKNWTPGGYKGETGALGNTGLQGATGLEGPQGLTGVRGFTGAGIQGATGLQGFTGVKGATGASGDLSIWVQAAMLGSAANTVGLFSTQPGAGNPTGVPVGTLSSSYGNGGVNPYRMPWGYYVSEVQVSLAHCAVSSATANAQVNFNLDFFTFTGTGNTFKGRVSVPLDGTNCGVYNNLGGNNYQFSGVTGLSSITGSYGDLVGFQFQNVAGPADLNSVSRATVLVKFQKS